MSVLNPDATFFAKGFIMDVRADCQFITENTSLVEYFLIVYCRGILFIPVTEGS